MEKFEKKAKKIASSVDDASKRYFNGESLKDLAQRVKEGAIANGERDLKMSQEWFWIEEEIWKEED